MAALVTGAALLAPHGATALAADAKAGRLKAVQKQCATCHGVDGLAKVPEAPNIAGQVEDYLVRALKAYQTGERTSEMMNLVAKTLSDADIADLSAYYAAIEITVTPPAQ